MEMEITETPQGNNNNKTIICPIITVWILFLINIIDLNSSTSYRYYTLIFLLIYLLSILLLLVIGILITLGIERGKYKLYRIGFIITIIYTIIQIFYIIPLIMKNQNYFITLLIYLLLDLILFIVLLLYRKKVKENSQDEVVRNINIDLQEGNNHLIQ